MAQKVQADLKKVGINAQLAPSEFLTMLTTYRAKKSAAVISYNQPDYLGSSDWLGQMILHTWAPRLYFDDPRLKDMTNKANAEQNQQKRVAMIHDILRTLVEDGPYVMLVQGKVQVVVRPSIQGYVYMPIGTARLFGVSKQ